MKVQSLSPARWMVGLGVFCLGVALVASSASAQQGGRQGGRGFGGFGGGFGGFGGGGGKSFYLANEQVRTELKITDDQKTKIEEISKKLREETSALVPRDLSREEAQKKREETAEQRRKLATDAETKIDEVLTSDQKKRLDEIVLQQQGNRALTTEKVVAALGLSAEQKTKIETTLEEQGKKQRELFQGGGQGGGGGREAFAANREKMEKLREETNTAIAGILTSEQKAKFEELKGKEFKMEVRGFGGGQGGAGGRGRRPGGNNN